MEGVVVEEGVPVFVRSNRRVIECPAAKGIIHYANELRLLRARGVRGFLKQGVEAQCTVLRRICEKGDRRGFLFHFLLKKREHTLPGASSAPLTNRETGNSELETSCPSTAVSVGTIIRRTPMHQSSSD